MCLTFWNVAYNIRLVSEVRHQLLRAAGRVCDKLIRKLMDTGQKSKNRYP